MTDHDVLAVDDLPSGEARQVLVDGLKVCVVRIDDDVYAIGDTCTHQNVSLAEGEVLADTCEIECWKHGSAFSLLDGSPHALPATRPEPVFEAKVIDGRIVVVTDDA